MKFNYQKICSSFLKDLSQRATDIIERRFGLKTGKRETLEAIGETHGITRERVRQIEEGGFLEIQSKIKEYQKIFQYFDDVLKSFGDIKEEEALLRFLGGENSQNHVFFLLTIPARSRILDRKATRIGDNFEKILEIQDFYPFWTRKKESLGLAKKIVKSTIKKFESKKRPLTLDELFRAQKTNLSKISSKKLNKDIFNSYLEISKEIQKNPEGQFGLKNWLEINPRGVKDKSYLVLKKQRKPLHFTQITDLIKNSSFLSQREIHTATVHNELIKDPRFVLVGRGLYALKEWGYTSGVVKDVIFKVLKESKKSLAKEEILRKVLKQRLVKENTVFLNLDNKKYFLKDSQGKYIINPIKEA